jgi:hypothetical protein
MVVKVDSPSLAKGAKKKKRRKKRRRRRMAAPFVGGN